MHVIYVVHLVHKFFFVSHITFHHMSSLALGLSKIASNHEKVLVIAQKYS